MLKNVLNAITKLFDLGKSLQGQSGVSQAVGSMRARDVTQATRTGRVIELDKPGELQAQAAKDLAQAVKDMREANKQRIAELRKPLSERIEGLSLDDRYDRLKAQGQLLGRRDVSRRLGGIRKPTREQVVVESEKQEQRNRARMADELEKRSGTGKKAGLLAMAARNPVTATIAVVASLVVATKAIKAFAERTLEGSRDLAQFNASIAVSFARLEFQRQIHGVKLGRGTQTSERFLAKAVYDLRDTMLPMKNAWVSFKNVLAGSLARALNSVLETSGLPELLEDLAKQIEKVAAFLGGPQGNELLNVGMFIGRAGRMEPMGIGPDGPPGVFNQPPGGRP